MISEEFVKSRIIYEKIVSTRS